MTLIEEHLTCGICRQMLQHPRSLKCLHSFCSTCIFEHVRGSPDDRPVGCPICKLEVFSAAHNTDNIQSFVNTLPENKFLNTLLSAANRSPTDTYVTDYKCTVHENTFLSKYCKSCHTFVCSWCISQNHRRCEIYELGEISELYHREVAFMLQEFRNVENDINLLHNTLLPKPIELLISKEDMSLEISKYFSDLKHKFEQYIINQQREVQKRFTQIVDKERKKMTHDREHCHALLGSLDEKYGKLSTLSKHETQAEKASGNLLVLTTLGKELEDYRQVSGKLRSENRTMPDMRFIINTEFEDSLTNTSLISVELLNSEQEEVEHVDGILQERHAVADQAPASEEEPMTLPPVPPRTSIPQEEVQRPQPTAPMEPTPPDINVQEIEDVPEEPPPPYPGLPEEIRNYESIITESQPDNSRSRPSTPSLAQIATSHPVTPVGADLSSADDLSSNAVSRALHFPRNVYLDEQCKLTSSSSLDKHSPVIVGLVWIDPGMVIALDKRNQLLKQLNLRTLQVSLCLRMPHEPWDMAQMEPFQSAIVVPKQRKIVLTANSRVHMTILQNISTEKPYSAISYNKTTGHFICGSVPQFASPCIDVIDSFGITKVSLENDNYMNKIAEYPRALSVCEDHVLFTDFKKKQVRSIDLNTNSIDIYNGRKMIKEPYGLACLESRKIVFLTDSNSNDLHVINKYTEEVAVAYPKLEVPHPGNLAVYESDVPGGNGTPPSLAVAFRNGVVMTYRMELS